jgi:hypothetical protein
MVLNHAKAEEPHVAGGDQMGKLADGAAELGRCARCRGHRLEHLERLGIAVALVGVPGAETVGEGEWLGHRNPLSIRDEGVESGDIELDEDTGYSIAEALDLTGDHVAVLDCKLFGGKAERGFAGVVAEQTVGTRADGRGVSLPRGGVDPYLAAFDGKADGRRRRRRKGGGRGGRSCQA